MTGYGLSVRWSLHEAAPGVADELRKFVATTSLARFSAMPGLRFKTWRLREGVEFEGVYVWATAEAREAFAVADRAGMHDSPGTRMIGSAPFAYDEFEVVAIAEGPEGFLAGPGPKTAEALSRG